MQGGCFNSFFWRLDTALVEKDNPRFVLQPLKGADGRAVESAIVIGWINVASNDCMSDYENFSAWNSGHDGLTYGSTNGWCHEKKLRLLLYFQFRLRFRVLNERWRSQSQSLWPWKSPADTQESNSISFSILHGVSSEISELQGQSALFKMLNRFSADIKAKEDRKYSRRPRDPQGQSRQLEKMHGENS